MGRTAGPHAELGRPPVRARSQDPRALSLRQADIAPVNELATPDSQPRARPMIGLWVLLVLAAAVFIAANVHLVHVATVSQPACLAHLRQGEGDAARGLYGAASSSCQPPTAVDTGRF